MSHSLTSPGLRQLSAADLEQLGQESLREHLVAQAAVARQRYAPVTRDALDRLLRDPGLLRYPTRIVFEFGEMALHQFAQPDLDWRDDSGQGRVLYVRPLLQAHPDRLVRAVVFMIPVINYGAIISDDHCVRYGAELMGEDPEAFYEALCELADFAGAEARWSPDPGGLSDPRQADPGSGSCVRSVGGGCGTA